MTEQELILTHIRNCRRVDLYSDPRPLTKEEQVRFDELRAKRSQGQPLQYLLGECEFMGLKFIVNPSVLIPRPETELLVELAVEKFKNRTGHLRVIDIGTGSGNIAVSLAKLIPGAVVTAMDCSTEALFVARNNAQANGVENQITFVEADIFSVFILQSKYDLIISNPPYIPSAEMGRLPLDVQQEPHLALDGGEDGLKFYRHIFAYASRHLNADGSLLTEIGDGQRPGLENILKHYPEFSFEFHHDYRKTDRILAVQKI